MGYIPVILDSHHEIWYIMGSKRYIPTMNSIPVISHYTNFVLPKLCGKRGPGATMEVVVWEAQEFGDGVPVVRELIVG